MYRGRPLGWDGWLAQVPSSRSWVQLNKTGQFKYPGHPGPLSGGKIWWTGYIFIFTTVRLTTQYYQ